MKLELEDTLEELERFHGTEALERIEDWYSGGEGEFKHGRGLDRPPHEFTAERASHLIRFALEIWDERDRWKKKYPPRADSRDILVSVGVESLLTGIAMKEDTDWFLHVWRETGDTPNFGDILNDKVPEWVDGLSGAQQERVVTVLNILREHRNNLVHFGFHQMRHNPDYPAYYDVLAYLFAEYFGSELQVVTELRERADSLRKIHANVEYQWLYFDF